MIYESEMLNSKILDQAPNSLPIGIEFEKAEPRELHFVNRVQAVKNYSRRILCD